MASLRQYATPSEISEILNGQISVDDINNDLLNEAESLIDSYVGNFLTGNLRKVNQINIIFDNVTFTNTTATLPVTNNYQFCVIRILGGSFAGRVLPILSQSGAVLSFDNIDGLTGVLPAQIEQIGKFPISRDTHNGVAWIPFEIKQAVAYQLKYVIDSPSLFESGFMKSESIGSSYSYTKGSGPDNSDIRQYMAPRALQLLKGYQLRGL